MLLELTVIRICWTFNFDFSHYLLAGVIWMIGWCMKGRLGKEFSKAADLLVSIMGPSELAANKYDQLALFAKIHAGILYGENITIEAAEEQVLEAVKKAETVEQFQSNMVLDLRAEAAHIDLFHVLHEKHGVRVADIDGDRVRERCALDQS